MNEKTGVRIVFAATVAVAAGVIALAAGMYTARPRAIAAHLKQPTPQAVQTQDQAAIDVFTYIYARSHSYEYGGVIIKWEGGVYLATDPDTQLRGDEVGFDQDPDDFPGGRIVASYHTHPCTVQTVGKQFSDADIREMRTTGLPGYMLDLCTGLVHYWAPGDKLDPPDFSIAAQLATGTIVGKIKVDGIRLR